MKIKNNIVMTVYEDDRSDSRDGISGDDSGNCDVSLLG